MKTYKQHKFIKLLIDIFVVVVVAIVLFSIGVFILLSTGFAQQD